MSAAINLCIEDAFGQWFLRHSEEIEKTYGIYVDEAIIDIIKQSFGMILSSLKYQSDMIKNNED